MMNLKQTATLVLSGVCLLAGTSSLANEIYKYTDENGTVHYVDRPTNAPSEERVLIASKKNTAAPRRQDADSADWRERRAERQAAADAKTKAKEDDQERARLCLQQRERLEEYKVASRLYRMDEQGERVYLSEEEIEEARRQVQNQIQEHCSS